MAPIRHQLGAACTDRTQPLVDGVGGASLEFGGATAADLISALVGGLPLPHRLRDVGIAETELPEIARLTMSDYMMANLPRPMLQAEVLALLTSAW